MRIVIVFIFLSLTMTHCNNEDRDVDFKKSSLTNDSVLVKSEIVKDSSLFNLLYLQSLTNFTSNVSEVTILRTDEIVAKRFYYKNNMRLFNYFLFDSGDTSFILPFNFIFNYELIYNLSKTDSLQINKEIIANLNDRITFNKDLNNLRKFLLFKKGPSFNEVLKLLIERSETIKIINKDNFKNLFNARKYKELGYQDDKIQVNKEEIERALVDENTIIGYSNNVFFVTKIEEVSVETKFYFQDIAKGWHL